MRSSLFLILLFFKSRLLLLKQKLLSLIHGEKNTVTFSRHIYSNCGTSAQSGVSFQIFLVNMQTVTSRYIKVWGKTTYSHLSYNHYICLENVIVFFSPCSKTILANTFRDFIFLLKLPKLSIYTNTTKIHDSSPRSFK